jgi:hypothetical protein
MTPAEAAAWTGPRCRGCGAPLRWLHNPVTGKLVPLSLITGENHFLDCPQAARFRRHPTTERKPQ